MQSGKREVHWECAVVREGWDDGRLLGAVREGVYGMKRQHYHFSSIIIFFSLKQSLVFVMLPVGSDDKL